MTTNIHKKQARTAKIHAEKIGFLHFFEKPFAGAAKRSVKKDLVRLPMLDGPIQKQFLKVFQAEYNHRIRAQRKVGQLGFCEIGSRGEKMNQTLKGSHLSAMIIICEQISRQMDYNNQHLSFLGMQAQDPRRPYHVFTNNKILKERLGCSSDVTVWNILQRLETCGFLIQKINHGTLSDYELLINSNFLLIHDLTDPDYRPISSLLRETAECGLPRHLIQKMLPLRKEKEPILNKIIKTDKAFARAHNETSLTRKDPFEKDPRKCKPECLPADSSPEGPGGNNRLPEREKIHTGGAAGTMSLKEYTRNQVLIFLEAAIRMLWPHRTWYGDYLERNTDYICSNYFLGLESEKQIDDRISGMYTVAGIHARWISRSKKRFALLPHQYFDVKRKPRGKDDFSGYKGGVRLVRDRERQQKLRELEKKQYQAQKLFDRWIRDYEKKPTEYGFRALEKRVKEKMPAKLPELIQYLTSKAQQV